MLFQVLCGFEPIFYTTHPNEESKKSAIYCLSVMVNDTSISATDEEIEDIKWTFRRTRKPKKI